MHAPDRPLAAPLEPIPRRPFALVCALGVVLSVGAGVGVAASAGASSMVLLAIGAVLLAGGALCVLPLLGPPLVTPERWGLVVMMASMARTGLAMVAMLYMVEVLGLPRRPVVIGLLTGTLIMMAIEALAAVWLLSRRERQRAVARAAGASATRANQSSDDRLTPGHAMAGSQGNAS